MLRVSPPAWTAPRQTGLLRVMGSWLRLGVGLWNSFAAEHLPGFLAERFRVIKIPHRSEILIVDWQPGAQLVGTVAVGLRRFFRPTPSGLDHCPPEIWHRARPYEIQLVDVGGPFVFEFDPLIE